MRIIQALTGIRGLAALWVVLFHIQDDPFYRFIEFGAFLPIVIKGYLAVDLFFMLSGFVISYVHQKEFQSFNLQQIPRFLQLRLARILPVHLFMLMVFLVIYGLTVTVLHTQPEHPDSFSALYFVYNVLLLHAWGLATTVSWNAPSWSVSAEWFAYLTFPLFTPLFARLQKVSHNILALSASFLGLCLFYSLSGAKSLNWTYDYGLIRVVVEFSMGCFLFNLFKQCEAKPRGWDLLAGAAVVLALLNFYVLKLDLLGVWVYAPFLFGLSLAQGWFEFLFSNKLMRYLGEISFSLYMVHNLCITLMKKVLRVLPEHYYQDGSLNLLIILLVVAVAITGAHFMYRYIEIPARDLLRGKLKKPVQPPLMGQVPS